MRIRQGVVACLAAGAIWGGIFVGPRMLPQYDALTFSLTRYACFGLLSCLLFARAHRATTVRARRADFVAAAGLGLVGNVVYFIALVIAIQWTSIAYASLIVGLLPVTTTLVADWRERRAGMPVIGIRRLAVPLAVIALGVACVNADLFLHLPPAGSSGALQTVLGVVAAFSALAAWTIYAIWNSEYLRTHDRIESGEWATLQGIGTGLWVIVAIAAWTTLALVGAVPGPHLITAVQDPAFAGWILFLGIGASWVGTTLWNAGAKALPPTLAGQMIVFETVFGLLYGFLFEARLPRALESTGIVCLLSGVTSAVRAHDVDHRSQQRPCT
jgi:drug/metabolite transporter (DMT)-like permease